MLSRSALTRGVTGQDATLKALLGFYKDTELPFGASLKAALGLDNDTDVTEAHITQFYTMMEDFGDGVTVAPDMLERALKALKIDILLRKIPTSLDRTLYLIHPIKVAFAAGLDQLDEVQLQQIYDHLAVDNSMAAADPYLNSDEAIVNFIIARNADVPGLPPQIPVTLSNAQFDVMYNKIIRGLQKQNNSNCVPAMAYITTMTKVHDAASTVDQLTEQFVSRSLAASTGQNQKKYDEDNKNKPNRRLEEIDFIGQDILHKRLLQEKLELLNPHHMTEFERFNGIIRKTLLKKPKTPVERDRVNVKIQYALGKLSQLLYALDMKDAAEDIQKQVFFTTGAHIGKVDKFPKVNPNEPTDREEIGFIKKAVASALKFFCQEVRRADLPVEITDQILPAQFDDAERRITSYVAALNDYPEETSASRKLANKIRSLARTLNLMEVERLGEASLTGIGVAADDELRRLYPLTSYEMFTQQFVNKFDEFMERTMLPADIAPGVVPNELYFTPDVFKQQRHTMIQDLEHRISIAEMEIKSYRQQLAAQINSMSQQNKPNHVEIGIFEGRLREVEATIQRFDDLRTDVRINAAGLEGALQFNKLIAAEKALVQCSEFSEAILQAHGVRAAAKRTAAPTAPSNNPAP